MGVLSRFWPSRNLGDQAGARWSEICKMTCECNTYEDDECWMCPEETKHVVNFCGKFREYLAAKLPSR